MILIFAGTFEQAWNWADKRGIARNHWRYLEPATTRGYMEPDVYLVGEYFARPDLEQMVAALLPCRPRFLDEDGQDVTLMSHLASSGPEARRSQAESQN